MFNLEEQIPDCIVDDLKNLFKCPRNIPLLQASKVRVEFCTINNVMEDA